MNQFEINERRKWKHAVTRHCCESIGLLSDVAVQAESFDTAKADIENLTDVINLCLKAQAELSNFLTDDDDSDTGYGGGRTQADDVADDPRRGQADLIRTGRT